MNKIIIINGKNNIDNLTKEKKERILLKSEPKEISYNDQLNSLNLMDDSLRSKLNNKIYSYKQQDIKRNLFCKTKIITINEVIQKLKNCNLNCHYCEKEIKIIYRVVRDPLQWTLDRIDNDIGHTNINTIISCLHCNLKRRRIKKEHFELLNQKIIKNN